MTSANAARVAEGWKWGCITLSSIILWVMVSSYSHTQRDGHPVVVERLNNAIEDFDAFAVKFEEKFDKFALKISDEVDIIKTEVAKLKTLMTKE